MAVEIPIKKRLNRKDYLDHTFDPPMRCGTAGGGGRLVYCECCGRRRFARDVVVQCYYDGRRLWCAPGRGCKNPKMIEAKRRREFHNRSKGQKRRWAALRSNQRRIAAAEKVKGYMPELSRPAAGSFKPRRDREAGSA